MQMMITGFTGWAKMGKTNNESVRVVDTAITVAATLLAAVTYVALR